MGLWGGRATGGGTVVVLNPGEATQAASLREAGLLGRARDAELDRRVSAACRDTGAALAALRLFDGDERLITHVYAQEAGEDAGRVFKGGLPGRPVLGEGETLDG
jgi:hypothetical protein